MTWGLFLLAIAPVIAIVVFIYHKDKYDHEPWAYLVLAYFLGLVCAAIVPFITGRIYWLPELYSGTQMEIFLTAFVVVALVEELAKFIFLRGVFFNRSVFNEPIDGIVYGVMIGMGFATLENLYFVMDGGWKTAVLRMFTAVPAHAIFGIVMGYYVGKAKYVPHKNLEYSLKALFVTIFLHGIYNYLLLQEQFPYLGIAAIIGLLVSFRYARKMIKEQQEASPFKPH